jgi:hypothetical protein
MSVDQLINELKALPQAQRLEIFDAVLGDDESWIPESFRKGMDDFLQGRTVDGDGIDAAAPEPPA